MGNMWDMINHKGSCEASRYSSVRTLTTNYPDTYCAYHVLILQFYVALHVITLIPTSTLPTLEERCQLYKIKGIIPALILSKSLYIQA